MAFITQINWVRRRTPDEQAIIDAKIAELVAEGKTDGLVPRIYTRVWDSKESAEAWIEFVRTSFNMSPDSTFAVIEE